MWSFSNAPLRTPLPSFIWQLIPIMNEACEVAAAATRGALADRIVSSYGRDLSRLFYRKRTAVTMHCHVHTHGMGNMWDGSAVPVREQYPTASVNTVKAYVPLFFKAPMTCRSLHCFIIDDNGFRLVWIQRKDVQREPPMNWLEIVRPWQGKERERESSFFCPWVKHTAVCYQLW